jgi:hypothetical protein
MDNTTKALAWVLGLGAVGGAAFLGYAYFTAGKPAKWKAPPANWKDKYKSPPGVNAALNRCIAAGRKKNKTVAGRNRSRNICKESSDAHLLKRYGRAR